MIGYRIRRFLESYREADRAMRLFLLWNATNAVLAFGLLGSAFPLLLATNSPGFQRTLLFGYIAVAVGWLLSVFAIGPAYDRVEPAD